MRVTMKKGNPLSLTIVPYLKTISLIIPLLLTLFVFFWGGSNRGLVQAADLREYDLKAAFVYNFALFAEWPSQTFSSPDSPIHLLVIGDKEITPPFLKIKGKKIGNRSLDVDFINPYQREIDSVVLSSAHIIFFCQNVTPIYFEYILNQISTNPTLTMGERKDFISNGGMVNFFEKNRRLLFEVHYDRVRKHRIQLSSRLLNLAIIIDD